MKIFAACFNTETNTFSVLPTDYKDFTVIYKYQFDDQPSLVKDVGCMEVWKELSDQYGHEIVLSLCAFAQPSGRIIQAVYEELKSDLLADLSAEKDIDIVLLDLHGAMAADAVDDCEADIIRSIREVVGPSTIIGVELDLHCHLSPEMMHQSDVIVCYKEYPHTDINDRAVELFELAVKAKEGAINPTMASFDCKMMGMYPTTSPIMHDFMKSVIACESLPTVLSISIIHGFPWGDNVDAGSKVLVVTDNAPEYANELAKDIGMELFSLRKSIQFTSHDLDTAMSMAFQSRNKPVTVADQSDNPGGGAPSDSTYALQWMIDNNKSSAAVAFLCDPEVVDLAFKAGKGQVITTSLGGKASEYSGSPVQIKGEVIALKQNLQHRFPQESGQVILAPLGDVAVVRYQGIDIFVTSERCQCFSPCFLDDLGLSADMYKVIVAKSTQHFHSAFSRVSNDIIYMSAPGAIPPNMLLIDYQVMSTGDKYPWNPSPFYGDAAIQLTTKIQ